MFFESDRSSYCLLTLLLQSVVSLRLIPSPIFRGFTLYWAGVLSSCILHQLEAQDFIVGPLRARMRRSYVLSTTPPNCSEYSRKVGEFDGVSRNVSFFLWLPVS